MKKQLTVRIDHEVLDKLRDIVYWNREFTLNSFVNLTLQQVVKKFNNVKPRPKNNLKPGRRVD